MLLQKALRRIIRENDRRRLKNRDFTIVSNSCWGGVVYHKLGLQFCSPFINLDFDDKDFYKLAPDIKYYMQQDLQFVHGIEPCPTAYLGDILLRFVHYHSDEEAREKWNTRKLRMNYDNMFLLCSDRPHGEKIVTDEDIASLKDIDVKGRCVFTVRDIPDLNYLVKVREDEEGGFVNIYMLDKTCFLQRWRWETAFDWVHFLNTGEVRK